MSLFLINRRAICCCGVGLSGIVGRGGSAFRGGLVPGGAPDVTIGSPLGGFTIPLSGGAGGVVSPGAQAGNIAAYSAADSNIPVFITFGALGTFTFGGRGDFPNLAGARARLSEWVTQWTGAGWTGPIPYTIRDSRNNQIIESS